MFLIALANIIERFFCSSSSSSRSSNLHWCGNCFVKHY